MITVDQLRWCVPTGYPKLPEELLPAYAATLSAACEPAGITTPRRLAAFIATCYWESGCGREFVEPTDGAAYEGSARLGNNGHPGAGFLYRGRGWIHVTGLCNYLACGQALGLDLANHPELLEDPVNAARSAVWFWMSRGLNQHADQGDSGFDYVTLKVNGDCTPEYPSYQLRRRLIYQHCCRAFGATGV